MRPLTLEIWKGDKLLAGAPLYLSFSGVEQMYRLTNLWFVNSSVTVPSRPNAPNEPPTNGKNLVFLHGYNVNQQQSRGVLSEMFKRFYWSGSRARFYGVTWNGAESQVTSFGFSPNLHTNEVNAFDTAPYVAGFLASLSGETTVAAHSLGNMVTLSAISDWSAAPNHYVMIDAAVPVEALQGDTPIETNMIYSTWQGYSPSLYASEWWKLFATNDARSTLTWNGCLENIGTVDIYNFYSSGEEVLREDDEDPPATIDSAIDAEIINNFWFGRELALWHLHWVWTEKGKGIFIDDGFLGARTAGGNSQLTPTIILLTILLESTFLSSVVGYVHMPEAEAGTLPNGQLKPTHFLTLHLRPAHLVTIWQLRLVLTQIYSEPTEALTR